MEGALSAGETKLGLISVDPLDRLPQSMQARLSAHWRVADALDPDQIAAAVKGMAPRLGPIHRLLGTLEEAQVPLAETRERLGIEGMSAEAARNFRDKARMKDVIRRAGLPCARHALATSGEEARAFAHSQGYPLVVKPPEGAGAKGTFRVDDDAMLATCLDMNPPSPAAPMLLEEFIVGEEHSIDTVGIEGRPVWHSITRYSPGPLEVVRNPWIQWCVLLPREVDAPLYDDIRGAAFPALRALGMETGLYHMEWFRRTNGTVAISEVGARPPGAQFTSVISWAHDFDLYRAWGRLVVHGMFDPPERRYAAGIAFLRGQGRGAVARIQGLDQAQRELAGLVVEVNLPKRGTRPASGYEGEGYVIVRHPETQVVENALSRIVNLIRVEMEE